MSNQLANYNPKQLFRSDKIQKKFEDILGKKAQGFITSVLQAISNNDMLKDAETSSVYNAAMTAAVLDLPINQNLGFAYIIPYKSKGRTVAQFQMGYKGYIQLCQRSGLFKTISATPVYEGQIVEENPLTGFEFNFQTRQSEKIIGYASYFALLNGFEKILYMTVDDVETHAKEYSQSYKAGYGPWTDNFEAMALKTVLKLLLSKYAPMTIEMEKAVTFDQGDVKDIDGLEVDYVDNAEPHQPGAENRQEIDIDGSKEAGGVDVKLLREEITAKAKELWGTSGFYRGIKKEVIDIDPNAENMLDLDDSGLLELHDRIMSMEVKTEHDAD